MAAITNGLFFGLMLAFFLGPVFFALMQTSIQKGFSSGFGMAIGICLSDAIFIVISYLGVSQALENDSMKMFLGIAGGAVLLVFGLKSLKKPVCRRTFIENERNPNIWKNVGKGFLLNAINPAILLFWIGVISIVSVEYDYSGNEALLFFATIVLTVFITDTLKAYLANRLREVVTTRFIKIMNRIVGIALVIFAVRLFYYALMVTNVGLQ